MINESEADAQTTSDGVATRNGQLLKADDVLRIYQISRGTLTKMIQSGRLRALRFGRVLRFRPSDVEAVFVD